MTGMTKSWSHKACFNSYDVRSADPRWSWSGKTDDGKTIAITCWQDRFEKGVDLFRSHTHFGETGWESRPGHNELIRNLAWARDNCDGVVRIIIIATPVDPNASPPLPPHFTMNPIGLSRLVRPTYHRGPRP